MKLAIFGRVTKTTDFAVLRSFFAYLEQANIGYAILGSYAEALITQPNFKKDPPAFLPFTGYEEIADCDFLFSIGGDGTILDAVRFIGRHELPILGVNAGRLGFLSSVSQFELIAATADLQHNAWQPDLRTLITVEHEGKPLFAEAPFGLNEITLHKSNTNEMIVVQAAVDGEFLNAYWTDGLIISTPTGSTAYSLAAGGPIISPKSGAFVITPIAPHSLTVRPVVIPDTSIITVKVESRSGQALVAIDTSTRQIPDSMELTIRKADFTATLVKLASRSYFSTLRSRLNWGLDSRN